MAELGEKMVVPLAPFNSPSALSTVPLIPYTATGNTVREDGAKIYSLYGTAYTEVIRKGKMIRLGHIIMPEGDIEKNLFGGTGWS